jgi:hypothetical protein
MRKLLIIVFLSFVSSVSWSQKNQKLKESYVDSASYVYFTKAKHNELVELTKSALSDGIDSYYLRVRIGVSFFNKNQFFMAAIHLRKALDFYPSDMYTKEFLFYSYLYLENLEAAKLIISKIPISYQEYYKKQIKLQKSFVFESGYQGTSYANIQDSTVFLGKDTQDTSLHGNGIYAESDRMKSILYYQIGLSYPISKCIKAYSGASLVQNNREQHIYSKNYTWDAVNLILTPSVKDTAKLYTLSQYQLYTGLSIVLPKNFNLQIGGQYMYYTQTKMKASYDSVSFTYNYTDNSFSRSNFVSNISLSKGFGKLIPTLSLGYNNIDAIAITQFSSQINYLPFGNYNLNVSTGLSLSKDQSNNRTVYFAKIGGKLTEKIWYETYFYGGNLKYFTEGNGYVVYNISDKITMKSGINLTYYLSQKINFGVRYDLLKRESNYDRYYSAKNPTFKSYTDNYLNHSLILNLVWKF